MDELEKQYVFFFHSWNELLRDWTHFVVTHFKYVYGLLQNQVQYLSYNMMSWV